MWTGATFMDDASPPMLHHRRPDTSGMAVAHGRFLDWTTAGKLRHRGHRALTDAHPQAPARRAAAGAQAVDRRVDIDPAPLIAAQLAVWALGDGEDYDVLDSIY